MKGVYIMYAKMIKSVNNNKGFSLTEIMIVVTIMGILVAVAVPVYLFSAKKHKENDCKMQRTMITTTVESAMLGQFDDGNVQDFIPTLATVSTGYHYKVRFNDAGEMISQKEEKHTDTNRDGICEVCGFKTEYQHVDKINNKKKVAEPDGKCDLCGKVVKYKYNPNDHVTSLNVKVNENQAGKVLDIILYGEYEDIEEQSIVENESGEPILNEETGEIQYIYKTDENGEYVHDEEGNEIPVMQTNHYCYTVIKNYNFFLKLNENLTLGDIRGNYRPSNMRKTFAGLEEYKEGCEYDYYCKKEAMKDTPFYKFFANGEMPRCPFDEDGELGYFYYIDAMGKCRCTCPECNS